MDKNKIRNKLKVIKYEKKLADFIQLLFNFNNNFNFFYYILFIEIFIFINKIIL